MSTAVLERFDVRESREGPSYCRPCRRVAVGEVCDYCGGDQFDRLSSSGQLFSYTVMPGPSEHAANETVVLALVKLAGGPLVMARILDADPGDRPGLPLLKVGLPVRMSPPTPPAGTGSETSAVLHFRPVRSE